uniref:Uncharacterized protein n=1 Tax=Anopheles epiroticus TaxID=199890 RepID=A0A182PE91_9DIPT
MGDLLALLNDINSTETEMEFCEDFNKLQLILNTTNQYVRSFDKIVFDSGNEPYIIEVVARLLRYLRVQNYLDGDNKVNKQYEPELRRITMYLLLNTDVSFRYDLEKEPRVNHLLNSLPQLTKCLLLNCIWGLDLDRFFYEMLRYAPLWFSMQFVDQAIVSLKYGKPYEVLERIESMVSAIYFAMCRTDVDWRKINRSRHVEHQRTLGRLYDYVVEMLSYFNTPNAARYEGWSRLSKHRYFGFVVKHLFSMTMACLDLYFRKPAIPVDPAMSVYELMDDRHVHKPAPEEYTQATETTLLKINHCLLNTLEMGLMHVTLERFCYWVEIDLFSESEETVTLQQVIGESAYRLCEDLKSHKHFRHSIVRHLTQFAMRPKTLAEKVPAFNLGTLMERLERTKSDEERSVYLNEFMSRSERVYDNAECLETVEKHYRLLTVAHLRAMIEHDAHEPIDESPKEGGSEEDRLGSDDGEPSEERMKLREIIVRAAGLLPLPDFNQLLLFAIGKFGIKFQRYMRPDLLSSVIQLVNQLAEQPTGGETDPTVWPRVQSLLFQCPTLFFERLVQSLYAASTSQDKVVDAVVALIARYSTVAKPYLFQHMRALMVDKFDLCCSPALSRFSRQLFGTDVYTPSEYMSFFLLQGMCDALRLSNRPAMYELMKLYESLFPSCWNCEWDGKDVEEKRKNKHNQLCSAVKHLANTMQDTRYKLTTDKRTIETYPDRMIIVSMALELMIATLEQMRMCFTEEGKKRQEFLNDVEIYMEPSTMYYMHHYLLVAPQPPPAVIDGDAAELTNGTDTPKERQLPSRPQRNAHDAFLFRTKIKPTSTDDEIVTYLVMTIFKCTIPEMLALARHERIGPIIPQATESGLARLLQCSMHSGMLRHSTTNFIQSELQVRLPAEVKRGRATKACQSTVDIVMHLLRTLEPGDDRDQALQALCGDVTELYRYVRSVAPTVKKLDQLLNMVLSEQQNQNEKPQDMEEQASADQNEKEEAAESMDTSENQEETP